jgi:hypothetical protein
MNVNLISAGALANAIHRTGIAALLVASFFNGHRGRAHAVLQRSRELTHPRSQFLAGANENPSRAVVFPREASSLAIGPPKAR